MKTTVFRLRAAKIFGLALIAMVTLPRVTRAAELGDYKIQVDASMPEEARSELLAGIETLPPAMRTPPGPPLRFQWRPEPSEFGRHELGVLAPSIPTRSKRGAYRLKALSAVQRERLWWRRAAVAAVIARWDRKHDWSRSRQWMKVALWESGGLFGEPEPRSKDPWSFSRPQGKRSPHLDLVTFAEEVFVPPSVMQPDAVVADAQVRCQERSKWRYLFESLDRSGLVLYRPHGTCPAFDRWADLDNLASLEVLMVTASSRRPESMFGHLMLRPVYTENAQVQSRGFQTVVQLVALTSEADGAVDYLWRGITGGFPMVVLTTTLASIRRTQLELEQRSIRRYRLALNRRERERMMDRIWDLEHHGTFEYRFFSDNCAAALVWLTNGAVDRDVRIQMPSAPWVMPGAVLDAIARIAVVRKGQTTPLLFPVPGTLLSTGERAQRAHTTREKLAGQLPTDLQRVHRQSLDPNPAVRARAYETLPKLVKQSGAPRPVYDWLALTAQMERYMADRAVVARGLPDETRPGKIKGKQVDPARRLHRRRQWLRHDPTRSQRPSYLVWSAEADPQEDGEAISLEEQVFYRITEIQAELVRAYWSDRDGQQWLDKQAADQVAVEDDWNARALPRSGAGRFTFSAGVADGAPSAMLAMSPLRTRLGDALAHGYSARTEVRLLDSSFRVARKEGWKPHVPQAHMTFFALRTMARDLPATRDDLLDELGWGIVIDWDRDASRRESERLSVRGELLWILDDRHGGSGHTVVSAAALGQARWQGWDGIPVVAAPISLLHRTPLGGRLANALRLEASWQPAAVFRELQPSFSQEARGRIDLELWVGSSLGRAWLVGPSAMTLWSPDELQTLRWQAWLQLQIF